MWDRRSVLFVRKLMNKSVSKTGSQPKAPGAPGEGAATR